MRCHSSFQQLPYHFTHSRLVPLESTAFWGRDQAYGSVDFSLLLFCVWVCTHVDWAREALWSPQGCDAACKPDHLGCSSSRPGRYGEQAMFNSSQNALVFLKHLPFKLKEKQRKLHLSILPACKAAPLLVALQISGVLEMRWKRSCKL